MIKELKNKVTNYWEEHEETIKTVALVGGVTVFYGGLICYAIYSGGRTKGQVETAMAFLHHNEDMVKAYDKAREFDKVFAGSDWVAKCDAAGEKLYRNVMRNTANWFEF